MRLINVNKTYHNKKNNVQALRNINLSFSNKGLTFIVGESGCGKTTLLNIISGRDKDYTGIYEKDENVESIEQEIMLFENLSIFDNLKIVSDDYEKILSFLIRFQLSDKDKKVKKLSVGEKKRVQIIRSLLSEASYLICDEPTASLDYENREQIMVMLKELSKDMGVIVVTHDIAIVEKYADRVIRMGKGFIIKDEPIIESEHHFEDYKDKKSLIRKFRLMAKMMVSRWQESLFQYGLLFLMLIVMFVTTFLFPSLNQTMNATANWMNSKNVLISQPNGGNIDIESPERFMDYDLYNKEDAYLARDNIPDIIAYQIGWNNYKYSIAAYEDYSNSFIPYVDYETFKTIVEKYKDAYVETGEVPFPQYPYCLAQLYELESKGSVNFDDYIFYDYRNFSGLKVHGYEMEYDWHIDSFPHINQVYVGGDNHHMDIAPYQLYDGVSLDLIEGKMPTEDNEILLTKTVATHLARVYGVENNKDLVGKEIDLTIFADIDGKHFFPFTVCGLTYMDSKYENQVFFMDGAFDSLCAKVCDYDPSTVTYQYLYFLCDANKDEAIVCAQLDRVLDSKESHFESYMTNVAAMKEPYQKPTAIFIYVVFAMLALFVLYIIMNFILNKRIKKENEILRRYQYEPLLMQMMKILVLILGVAVVQILSLSYVCEGLNAFANAVGIANIVSYDVIHYVLSLLLSSCIVIMLEGGAYAIRVK